MLQSRKDLLEKLAKDITTYSPVIVQGEVGVGKTFFIKELCKKLVKNGTIKEYTIHKSWETMNSMIEAMRNKEYSGWCNKWFDEEIIVIDDFQFIVGYESTIHEFYELFASADAPIIIATTVPICEETFREENISNFCSRGTTVSLCEPTRHEVVDFFNQTLKEYNISLTLEAFVWLIAKKIKNMSIAKGIVNTLRLYSETNSKPIDIFDVRKLEKRASLIKNLDTTISVPKEFESWISKFPHTLASYGEFSEKEISHYTSVMEVSFDRFGDRIKYGIDAVLWTEEYNIYKGICDDEIREYFNALEYLNSFEDKAFSYIPGGENYVEGDDL